MFTDAFERLRRIVDSNVLGRINQITFNHLYELGQIRHGPFDSWMLRAPGNVILETGPHLISALLELVGNAVIGSVIADRRVTLPNGNYIFIAPLARKSGGRQHCD